METDNPEAPLPIMLFDLGRIVATPAALAAMKTYDVPPLILLNRHVSGSWGGITEEMAEANERAVLSGGRIRSLYRIGDDAWLSLETDAARLTTTFTLPGEI